MCETPPFTNMCLHQLFCLWVIGGLFGVVLKKVPVPVKHQSNYQYKENDRVVKYPIPYPVWCHLKMAALSFFGNIPSWTKPNGVSPACPAAFVDLIFNNQDKWLKGKLKMLLITTFLSKWFSSSWLAGWTGMDNLPCAPVHLIHLRLNKPNYCLDFKKHACSSH